MYQSMLYTGEASGERFVFLRMAGAGNNMIKISQSR